ncbi:sperm acrosome membrane-associated protein 6 isoform X2 [Meriones unguiculatus]|uniref:sperm acrosome membrane-associated protein 6 isoform X2 n=1 Tax=Meriones unguiculatus TaxID=10047 RepID=UPI00293E2CEC|nr:sperm acrosome membrane-associated protein 6 isoform X2 [Meriones unguiculatus]
MALVTLVGSIVLLFLLILRASTWACLFCFTAQEERLRVCQMFVGKDVSKLRQCKDTFETAFEILSDMEINYDERSHLHDAFTQMILSLQEVATAQGSFIDAFPSAAAEMKRTIQQLKKVQACVPPCGVQEFTRLFHCQGCYSTICDLPLDCPGEGLGLGYQGRGRPYAGLQESPDLSPVQDLIVKRGNQALFSCTVGFQLPESELTYSWKFAEGGLRTRDMSYFRDVPGAHGYLARIRPVQPKHSGTFVCVILHDQRPLARLYFYLNVTGPPPPGEMELQVTFREVVNWSAREAEVIVPWSPSLGELLALPRALTLGNLFLMAITAAFLSASVTVLAWPWTHPALSEARGCDTAHKRHRGTLHSPARSPRSRPVP